MRLRTSPLRTFLRLVLAFAAGTAAPAVMAAEEGSDGAAGHVPAGAAAALRDWGDVRQEIVLESVVVGANLLDLKRFIDTRPPTMLLTDVRLAWSQRPGLIHGSERDGWRVLTQAAGGSVEMLELRGHGSGSEGRWSRLQRGGGGMTEAPLALEAALPSGSRVLSRLVHQDGGRRMATLVATTNADAGNASREIIPALQRQGFRLGSGHAPATEGGGQVFFLARGREDLAVTISDHLDRRAVVMHWGSTVR
jgi:hypothetical protein